MKSVLEGAERVLSLQAESERRASGEGWLLTSQNRAERVDNIYPSLSTYILLSLSPSLLMGYTVMFLNNIINPQSLVPECATREDNIDFWRAAWIPCSERKGWCYWNDFHSNGFLIVSWYIKRPGMRIFMTYWSSSNSGFSVIFLPNMLNVKSSVIGWATRDINIDFWRVEKSL